MAVVSAGLWPRHSGLYKN